MTTRDGGFYVGYLPLPPGHRRFLRAAIPALVAAMVGLSAAIAVSMRDPGAGRYETGAVQVWIGTLAARPYATLIDDHGHAMLIVELGKHGPRDSLAALAGRRVRLSGWRLQREGRSIVELEPGDAAVTDLGPGATIEVLSVGEGPAMADMAAEILDSKCYLGAMKPGDGKAHKACATLCVRGGIPPMVRVEGPQPRWYVLASESGGDSRAEVLEWIGEPVWLRGRPARLGDMDVLLLEPGSVRRR